jgi:ABC-type polysaccharide/polyol phosphate transport system ATPase subunit
MSASSVLPRTPDQPGGGAALPSVSVRRLSKSFTMPHLRYHTLKERALHPFRRNTYWTIDALKDVSFDVQAGEFFGIVGRNGSGKSTLLKCLAGIYAIDRGTLDVAGRVSPFIELGVGFNLDLTAEDNVIINAIMLGLTRRQARERLEEVIAFAELEEFLDLKLKNYSSGMLVRLAFSVAIQVDAEILLIDEVLAVGDASFQQKCFDAFNRLRSEGRTVLFVTHDMAAVERSCDRAMLLERGQIVEMGDPARITRRYNEVNFERVGTEQPDQAAVAADAAATVLEAWFEDAGGRRIVASEVGEEIVACMRVAVREPLHNPLFSLIIRDELRHPLLAVSTERTHRASGQFAPGETVCLRCRFTNWLAPSRYMLTAITAREGSGADVIDHRPDAATLVVHGPYRSGGLTDLPYELDVVRG